MCGQFGCSRPFQDYSSGPGTQDGRWVLSSLLVGLAGQKQL